MKKTIEHFDQRNNKKKEIEFSLQSQRRVDQGEFRWYREGINIGNEISKDGAYKRVCLVLNTKLGNGLVVIAPITTKYHEQQKNYYISIHNHEKYNLKTPQIITNQIKLIDKKRFSNILSHKKIDSSFCNMVLKRFCDILLQKQE